MILVLPVPPWQTGTFLDSEFHQSAENKISKVTNANKIIQGLFSLARDIYYNNSTGFPLLSSSYFGSVFRVRE